MAAAIASLIRGWVAHSWVNYAMMLADGRHSTFEIYQLLNEYGFEVEVNLFNALLDFMVSEGFARILTEKKD